MSFTRSKLTAAMIYLFLIHVVYGELQQQQMSPSPRILSQFIINRIHLLIVGMWDDHIHLLLQN